MQEVQKHNQVSLG